MIKLFPFLFGLLLLVQTDKCQDDSRQNDEKSTISATTDPVSMIKLSGAFDVIMVGDQDYSEYDITINIESGQDARISGVSACNQYSGSLELLEDQKVNIGMLMSTKMYCPETSAIEKDFTKHLSLVKAYSWDGDYLQLQDADAKILITAKAAHLKK